MGDDWGRGFARIAAATVARGGGDIDLAIDQLSEAEQFGEKVGHPLLIGMARTVRGFCHLDRDDPAAAERDARATLELVEPYGVLDTARVGPAVLLAESYRVRGDVPAALRLLDEVAEASEGVTLLLPRRQVGAIHAQCLLCAGRTDDAVARVRSALEAPGEDVRSGVLAYFVLARALTARGDHDAARAAADSAVQAAYATEQTADRAAADALAAELSAVGTGQRHSAVPS